MPNKVTVPPSIESEQPLLSPIKLVNRTLPMHSLVKKHSHDWGQFVYANTGVLSVVTDTEHYIVPPEQGVWIRPNTNHEVTALTEAELTSFYFDNNTLIALPNYSCVLVVDGFLKSLICEAKKVKLDYQWSDADGLLLRLIVKKLACAPQVALQLPYPKDKRLLAMLTLIQQAPSNNCNLAQWGKEVGASSRTLSRLFKKDTGLSYTQWRTRLTIQIAISKLGSGKPIASIAAELGYESSSAFSYMFKENTGVSPSFYRKKL